MFHLNDKASVCYCKRSWKKRQNSSIQQRYFEDKDNERGKPTSGCVGVHAFASDLFHNSSCIRGIKNIRVHSAYHWESGQLSGDGPPTPRESTVSARLVLRVDIQDFCPIHFWIITAPTCEEHRLGRQKCAWPNHENQISLVFIRNIWLKYKSILIKMTT